MMNQPAVSPFDDEVVDPVDTAALQASPAPADPAAMPPAPAKARKPRKSPSRPDPQTITVRAGTQDLLAIHLVVDNAGTEPGSTRLAAEPRRLGGVVRGPSGSGDVAVAAPALAASMRAAALTLVQPAPSVVAQPGAALPSAKAQAAMAQPAAQPGTIVIHIPAKTVVLGAWAIIVVGFLALMGGGL